MAVQVDPQLQSARMAYASGRVAQAKALCDEVLSRQRRNADALLLKGEILSDEGRYHEAATCLEQAARLDPKRASVHGLLGEVEKRRGNYKAALRRYDRAQRLNPDSTTPVTAKAEIYFLKGDYGRALTLLDPYLSRGREDALMALFAANCLDRKGESDRACELIARHEARPEVPGEQRAALLFVLGKILERREAYDEAFAAYARANEAWAVPDAPDRYERLVDEMIEHTSAEALAKLPRADHGLRTAVLIVGMPRCGSTLVEQIIDSHPDAAGAGEFVGLAEIVEELPLTLESPVPYPACLTAMTLEAANMLGGRYVDLLQRTDRRATRVADKQLSNYEHLGLLSLIAPEANIIDCRRDPMDNCVSAFMEPLNPARYPYACSLAGLGRRYRQYERLMNHWHEVLDARILRVDYAALTAEPEAETRRLIEFIGLPWDDRCLRFHESKREAMTLSREQVKKPIYRSSVNRAARFGALLDPLRQALGI